MLISNYPIVCLATKNIKYNSIQASYYFQSHAVIHATMKEVFVIAAVTLC